MIGAGAAAVLAAVLGRHGPVVSILVSIVSWWIGRPRLLLAATVTLIALLSARAWTGLAPIEPGPFEGGVRLVSDPDRSFGSTTARARTPVGYLDLRASGPASAQLQDLVAGSRITVVGRTEPLARPHWDPSHHVRGVLVVTDVTDRSGSDPLWSTANWLRRLVLAGAESLPASQRSIFAGFVLGDDRDRSAVIAHDFLASGLSHLLVVSGANLVFVLAVVQPMFTRLGRGSRLVATLGVIVLFAAMTRFEASILRASMMVVVVTLATARGRAVSPIRALALAVIALLLIDPLLAFSMGFRLSVAATSGLVMMASALGERIPGPRAFARAVGATVSAQLGVAPILLPAFGSMPLVAIPANLLVAPVAGLLMMWGSAVGPLAGLAGEPAATILHLPTRVGLWWVMTVARVSASAPIGSITLVHLSVGTLVVASGMLVRRRWRATQASRGPLLLVSIVATAVALVLVTRLPDPSPPLGTHRIGGAELHVGVDPTGGSLLVVDGRADAESVLRGLDRFGIGKIDVVVVRTSSERAMATVGSVCERITCPVVWAPDASTTTESARAPDGPLRVGSMSFVIRRESDRLEIERLDAGGSEGPASSGPGAALGS